MKILTLQLIFSLFLCSSAFSDIGHTKNGTEYGKKAVIAYSESNHGPDGKLFLDPYFKHDLENAKEEKILDAGCGAAPWSIYAAKHGGRIYAIDIQESMVEEAEKAIKNANLTDKILIAKGDVASLPYSENFFDKEISICVGCNLPPDSFEKHFLECRRTLKKDGIVVVGAPTSLDVVFTNGSKTETEAFLHINEILNLLPDNPSSELISDNLLQLKEVLSATFYIKNKRLSLVANEKDLKDGEKIWRKLPCLVVPNNYYTKEFYAKIFKKYSLHIKKVDLPHFKSEEERIAYNEKAPENSKLGREYVTHAPFVIFHLVKDGEKIKSQKSFVPIVAKTFASGHH